MRSVLFRAGLLLALVCPVALVAVAGPAAACPFCAGGPDGVGANEVHAGIFDGNFWPRFGATLAPFPLLIGIVAWIYFGPPGGPRSGPPTCRR